MNEVVDEETAPEPMRCPNHAEGERAPIATVLVGARHYCGPCGYPMLDFIARITAISVKQQINE